MERKNFKIKSDMDGLELDTLMLVPEGEIKGIFQISHGMAEHKERYLEFMEYLTKNGYVTIIHDHRGHGKSIKEKQDLGFFYDKEANYVVEDLHQITKYVKEQYPDKEVILFGHSMGSMIVRKYIKKYDSDISKLIVCGSPSKNEGARAGLRLAKLIEKTRGEKYRSNLIQFLAFGSYVKKEHKTHTDWICANEETVEKYNSDELCGYTFTANGFENLFQLVLDIYDENGWNVKNENLPILFIAGSDDPVIISPKKWLEAQNFLRKIGYKNIKNKFYENLRHEILNEKTRDIVYKDILKFIEE